MTFLSLFVTFSAVGETATTQPVRPEVLNVSGIVTCPAEKIWKCFTTGEGIVQAWGVKIAKVDFRVGGMIRTSYDPNIDLDSGNAIGNQILAYEPNRLLIIKPIAPAGASDDIKEICKVGWNAIYLDPVAPDRTRVTVAGMGYAHTPLLDKAYEKFKVGNAHTLKHMQSALGDPESDLKVRRAFDLLKSLEGEWICEGVKDDPAYRACAVWKTELNGCLLQMHHWLGDAGAMRSESNMQVYVDPDTGGLVTRTFFATPAVTRGCIRLLEDHRIAIDCLTHNGGGEPTKQHLELSAPDDHTYEVSTWDAATETSAPPSLVVRYSRVTQAPPDFKRVK